MAVAILGLTLSTELWWVYFLADQDEAEDALRAMTLTKREFYAANVAYYWAHLLILLGIARIAAALEHAIGHAFDPLSFARASRWEAGPPSTSPGMRSSGAHSASPSSPGARSRWCSRSRRPRSDDLGAGSARCAGCRAGGLHRG